MYFEVKHYKSFERHSSIEKCSTQDQTQSVRVGVFCAEWNGFLVLVEEGDFSRTRPWHRDGWVVEFSWYYYFGQMVYMDPFDERLFDSLGFFSAYSIPRGLIALDDQVGGYCCWLDAGDWWVVCRLFLLLEVPIDQNMEGFLGWVTRVVGDLFGWVVGVRSSAVDGSGSPLQVMDLASVLMRFSFFAAARGFSLSVWPKSIGLGIALLLVCGMMRGWRRGCSAGSSYSCFALAIICV
jgi:hypothetical protein